MSLMRTLFRWLARKERKTRRASDGAQAFGLVPSPEDLRDDQYALKLDAGFILPLKADLSSYSEVKNQGWIGSCASHAICSGMEVLVRSNGKQAVPLSERWHYYKVRQKAYMNTFPKDSGQYIRSGMKLAASEGIAPEQLCSYNEVRYNDKPSLWADGFAGLFKIQAYRRCWSIEAVKQALAQGMPCAVGMDWYTEDLMFGPGGREGELRCSGKTVGGHAICFLGYDNEHKNPDGTSGAFKFVNSWGTRWGQQGYGWVSYQNLRNNFIEAFAVEVTR